MNLGHLLLKKKFTSAVVEADVSSFPDEVGGSLARFLLCLSRFPSELKTFATV